MRIAKSAEVSVDITAPVGAVWRLVGDVTRARDWSVECRGGEWIDGATGAAPGARFRGRNGRNGTRWSRTCEIVDVEANRRVTWRTLPTRLYPDSTLWQFELEPTASGTRLTQRMKVLHIPALHDRVFALVLPQHKDRSAELQADLNRIKQAAESTGLADAQAAPLSVE